MLPNSLKFFFRSISISFFLFGCDDCPRPMVPFSRVELQGREEQLLNGTFLRRSVYEAKIPKEWSAKSDERDSILDTTKPNASWIIHSTITVSFHSFPSNHFDERIPSQAQVARWRKQLQPIMEVCEPVSFSGFSGLYYEGENETEKMMAWSMQLDSGLYQALLFCGKTHEEKEFYKQLCADFTIKAYGPKEKMNDQKKEICFFAHHLGLIQEIPGEL